MTKEATHTTTTHLLIAKSQYMVCSAYTIRSSMSTSTGSIWLKTTVNKSEYMQRMQYMQVITVVYACSYQLLHTLTTF